MTHQSRDRSVLDRNRNNAVDFYRLALNTNQYADAMAKYTGGFYKQHNPNVPDDKEGFIEHFEQWERKHPEGRSMVVRAIADGDYVGLHARHHVTSGPKDTGIVSFDIFQLDEDGKLIEHWDGMQNPPLETVGGRSMVDGPTEVTDLEKTEANKQLVKDFAEKVLLGGDRSSLDTFFNDDNLIQHNPWMEDGVSNWLEGLEKMEMQGRPMKYHKLHRILGEGNYVLTQTEGDYLGVEGTAILELFRVEGGKIAEHWDAVWIKLPEKFQHNNTLF